MKIVIVASLTKSLINFRGSLLEAIVESGDHEVIACAPEDDQKTIGELRKIGVAFRRMPMARASTNPFADLHTLARLSLLFRKERPDIVLAYTQKPIIYGGMAARLSPRARFFAMQSGLGFAFSEENTNRRLQRLVSFLYRIGVAKAETVFVFNSDDEAEMRVHKILGPRHSVVQVPGSGVDIGQFSEQPFPERPTFLLVARLMRDKGLYEFVEAARRVRAANPSARFQILGPFDANPASIAAADLDRWREEGVIEYLGVTDDVRPFLADSTVFVLPSFHREGLPRSILEAMATGRPIITTQTPGCRETVVEGENGFLVQARDAGALAEAMIKFMQDPLLAARMGAASRGLAETKFDVDIVNDRVLRTIGLRGDAACRSNAPRQASDPVRRALDVVGSVAGLVVGLPLGVFIAAVIVLTLGRPVFFVQKRAGRHRKTFNLVKFRTMTDARSDDGGLLGDEQRLASFGRFLRRSRLDELPELWNILVGEMAFVGPRPLLSHSLPNQGSRGEERLSIRPGLTGWAQVNGNTLLDDGQKLNLDLWYVKNRSLGLDLVILLKTAGVILIGERLSKTAQVRE